MILIPIIATIAAVVAVGVAALPKVAGLLQKYIRPGVEMPGYGLHFVDNPWDVRDLASLLDAFCTHWPGPDPRPVIAMADVVCLPGTSFRDELGRRVAGLTRANGIIVIASGMDDPRRSALLHELAHFCLRHQLRDDDPRHKRVAYWRSVERANEA